MSYPQHPDTIVIKNEYYPRGLREIDIWNYYQKVKNRLLKETLGKTIIVFFATNVNQFIVIRKDKSGRFVRLTPSDYDTIVSGRYISFHSVMDKYSSYGIVDVDTDNFLQAKELTTELYYLLSRAKFVDDLSIRFTGKDSFHLKVEFKGEYPMYHIKDTLNTFLKENQDKISIDYTISARRTKKIPNLDLQRNIYNAGHISLYSLAVTGLRCMEVGPRQMKMFRKDFAKI